MNHSKWTSEICHRCLPQRTLFGLLNKFQTNLLTNEHPICKSDRLHSDCGNVKKAYCARAKKSEQNRKMNKKKKTFYWNRSPRTGNKNTPLESWAKKYKTIESLNYTHQVKWAKHHGNRSCRTWKKIELLVEMELKTIYQFKKIIQI